MKTRLSNKEKVLVAVIAIVIISLILFVNLDNISFDRSFYHSKFEKYGIYERFNDNKSLIDTEFSKVLGYLEGNQNRIESGFFNSKEKQHLKDVKGLFEIERNIIKFNIILFIILILFLCYIKRVDILLKGIMLGSCILIGIIVLLSIFIIFDFNSSFIIFHRLFFSNNLWQLDPGTDNLINLLPKEIFIDIAIRWGGLMIISSMLFLVLGYIWYDEKER